MAGKTPSRGRREKGHTSRPYDRPNQSLLGRVASTVKGLLKPSWLFSIPSWAKGTEEDSSPPPYSSEAAEPDLTENEDESDMPVLPRLPSRSKRPRIEMDNANSLSDTQTPFWLLPSTSRENLTEKAEVRESSSVIGSCQIGRKDTPVVVNGDDQSENSDASASTSGCSSLISSQDKPHRSSGLKLSESALEHLRGELKNKPAFQRPKKDVSIATDSFLNNSAENVASHNTSLWSCGTQTVIKSPQRPSLINSSRPSFNISSFGAPSKQLNPLGSKIASPFYEGSTMFGGASSYRRRQLQPGPYQSTRPVRSHMKVKETQASGEFECMSSAAKRILNTLEKMSTPVTDAKRIPSVDRSPLDISLTVTPPSQRLKSYLSFQRKSPAPLSKATPPPIVNLNSISKLTLLKNHKSRLSRNSMMEIPLQEQPIVPLQETTNVPSGSAAAAPGMKSGGGKVRTRVRQALHAPARAKGQLEGDQPGQEEYELPDIALPVTNMPVISFDNVVKPASKTIPEQRDTEENELSFTFSNPIEYSTPACLLEPQKPSGSAFKFSSPLVVGTKASDPPPSEKQTLRSSDTIITNGSVEDVLKRMKEKISRQENADAAKASSIKTGASEEPKVTSAGFGDKFKPKPGSWCCSTCFVQNDENSKACVACEAAKPGLQDTPSSSAAAPVSKGFSEIFKLQPGTWECPTCMVRNKDEESKCIACESPNPNPAKDKSTGDAASTQEEVKTTPSVKDSFSASTWLFADTSGTWECDTCLVRNSLDKSKCIACETLRPSKNNKANAGGFFCKFGQTDQKSSPAAFKFGSLESTPLPSAVTTTTTTTILPAFKFGVPSNIKTSVPSSVLSVFGASVSSSATAATITTFKFGVLTEPSKTSTPTVSAATSTAVSESSGIKLPEPKEPAEQSTTAAAATLASSTFKFGVPADTSKLCTTTTAASTTFVFGEQKADSKTQAFSPFKSISEGTPTSVTVSTASSEATASSTATTTTSVISSVMSVSESEKPAEKFKFGLPVVSTTFGSGGFNFQSPAVTVSSGFGSSPFSSAAKSGSQILEATETVKSSNSMLQSGFKLNTSVTSVEVTQATTTIATSSSSFPTTTTIHSKSSTSESGQTPVMLMPVPFGSGIQKSPAPSFSFGVPASSGNADDTKATAPSGTFGFFGSNITKQPSAFKINEPSQNPASKSVTPVFGTTAQSTGAALSNASSTFVFTSSFPSQVPVTNQMEMKETGAGQDTNSAAPPASSAVLLTTTAAPAPIFAFGSTNAAATSPATLSSVFAVASTATSTAPTMSVGENIQKTASVFKFGDTSQTGVKTLGSGFTFKRGHEDKTSGFPTANKMSFTPFKADSTESSGMNSAPAVTPFQFGSSAQTQSAGGFVFGGGAQKTETSPAPTPQFSFGSGQAKPSPFATGFPSSQTPASSAPAFSFGSNMSAATTTSSSVFNPPSGGSLFTFGAKSNQPSLANQNPAPSNPTPMFGAPTHQQQQQQQQQFVFGSSAATAGAAFGNVPTPAFGNMTSKPETVGGFSFGAPTAAAPQQSQPPVFVFGASSDKPSGTPQSGFNFSMTPKVEGGSSFGQGFNINTPPNFNFGVTSTPNQPFHFQASTEGTSTNTTGRRVRKAIRRGPRKTD